jgi:hypothetical protein
MASSCSSHRRKIKTLHFRGTVLTEFDTRYQILLRSVLWNLEGHVDRSTLPSAGAILEDLSNAEIDGRKYDIDLPERLKTTMY